MKELATRGTASRGNCHLHGARVERQVPQGPQDGAVPAQQDGRGVNGHLDQRSVPAGAARSHCQTRQRVQHKRGCKGPQVWRIQDLRVLDELHHSFCLLKAHVEKKWTQHDIVHQAEGDYQLLPMLCCHALETFPVCFDQYITVFGG